MIGSKIEARVVDTCQPPCRLMTSGGEAPVFEVVQGGTLETGLRDLGQRALGMFLGINYWIPNPESGLSVAEAKPVRHGVPVKEGYAWIDPSDTPPAKADRLRVLHLAMRALCNFVRPAKKQG